ncbi:unnamed protein product [Callosobruchus maculatus]|uniref:Uncharacterized protein n=1 Tax=Callosobruchus maculatus TaxID=64391 RepID=A0A653CPG4_CALMS|nr:unnamed protein product [Callosobruchus maculatus]
MILKSQQVGKHLQEASPEPKKVKPAYILGKPYPLSVMPMPLLRVPHSESPPAEENLDEPRDLESPKDVDTPQEGFSVLPPVQLENFALESRKDVDTPQEGFSVLPAVQLENFAERIAPIEAKLEEAVNIPVIEVKKLEVPVHAPLKQFKKLYASPIIPAIQREDEKERRFESEGNGGDDTPKFWPHYHSESAKK